MSESTITKNAIAKAQDAGIQIVLASGRPVQGVWPVAEQLRMRERGGYILAFNGGQIIDCATGRTVFQQTLPPGAPAELAALARERGVSILTYEDDFVISESPEDKYVQKEATINALEIRKIEDFAGHVTFPVVKCLIVGDGLEPIEQEAKRRFGDRMSIMRSEPYFLEAMSQGIDKAASLKHLTELLGVTLESLAACGDGFNDVSMIACAGLGIAMDNAQPPVKEAARVVTRSNDEDGVAYAIEQYLLSEAAAHV